MNDKSLMGITVTLEEKILKQHAKKAGMTLEKYVASILMEFFGKKGKEKR